MRNALGRIHCAGAPIVAMAMTDSPHTQAEVDCNAAANVGRPAAMSQETLRNRTKLRKVRRSEGREGRKAMIQWAERERRSGQLSE